MLRFQGRVGQSWGCVGTWPRGCRCSRGCSEVQGADRRRFTGQPFPPWITACFDHCSSRVVLTLTLLTKAPWEKEEAGCCWKGCFPSATRAAQILLAKQTSQNAALP